MGPTGSGKSTVKKPVLEPSDNQLTDLLLKLIDALTPTPWQHRKGASEGQFSFTRNIHAVRYLHHVEFGDRLVLVETPGFDDKERSDIEILALIGNWLKKT
jgi:hypothetical protein